MTNPVADSLRLLKQMTGGYRFVQSDDVVKMADDCIAEIERLNAGLRTIRVAGENTHPTAVWMQKVAAHAMEPGKWPAQADQPPNSPDEQGEVGVTNPKVYTDCVSDEPLEVIRGNECETDPHTLTTKRVRRLWNEIDRLTRERADAIDRLTPLGLENERLRAALNDILLLDAATDHRDPNEVIADMVNMASAALGSPVEPSAVPAHELVATPEGDRGPARLIGVNCMEPSDEQFCADCGEQGHEHCVT